MSDPREDGEEKDEKNFLSRWSRRKIKARGEDSGEGPIDPPKTSAPAAPAPDPGQGQHPAPTDSQSGSQNSATLPTIDELRGLESEYREFLRPGVDETLRRTALKKLFQDPHFNIMDGLDTYIDDYSKEDPIPEAMLKALNQAKGLIFDREEERATNETQPAAAEDAEEQAQAFAPVTPPVLSQLSPDAGDAGDDDVAQSRLSKPGTQV